MDRNAAQRSAAVGDCNDCSDCSGKMTLCLWDFLEKALGPERQKSKAIAIPRAQETLSLGGQFSR